MLPESEKANYQEGSSLTRVVGKCDFASDNLPAADKSTYSSCIPEVIKPHNVSESMGQYYARAIDRKPKSMVLC